MKGVKAEALTPFPVQFRDNSQEGAVRSSNGWPDGRLSQLRWMYLLNKGCCRSTEGSSLFLSAYGVDAHYRKMRDVVGQSSVCGN
jgi:hypothetical protein